MGAFNLFKPETKLTSTSPLQVRYANQSIPSAKSARSRGSYLRVSFKNTRETCQAIKGWKLQRAVTFLENVIAKKEAVPMRRFAGSTGRTAQGKQFGVTKARWPVKSAEFVLGLIKNAEANADTKGLDTGNLIVKHIQVNEAPAQRRRTYRAHGRVRTFERVWKRWTSLMASPDQPLHVPALPHGVHPHRGRGGRREGQDCRQVPSLFQTAWCADQKGYCLRISLHE
ncbi:60S ribosomal protein L17 [Ascosphaera atra]|nr:60S ribosomal protein L17 [Ascosphaera atra]